MNETLSLLSIVLRFYRCSHSTYIFFFALQSFPGASRDAVIYHKMSVYVNFIAHKIKAEKGSKAGSGG